MLEVEKTFRKFAVFKDASTTSNSMTGKNFFKILKECGVMDGKAVTSTDVDIAFNEHKTKGSRNINYIEFLQAIKDLSGKRFKGKSSEEAMAAVIKLIEGKEPATHQQ
ncbi:tubulin polymerization-promoting protein family member 2-like [Tiliqua scincoides]|uniref:tubulin polymerization-promoting protein family member 2-like n=1 Tax=Tiliqua scincoides TaxID=71010 RepID=UPI0034633E63